MEVILVESIGWVGAALLLLAYGLNSYGKVQSNSIQYQSLNMVASFFFIINTVYHKAIPSTALNLVWILIGVIALVKNKKKTSVKP